MLDELKKKPHIVISVVALIVVLILKFTVLKKKKPEYVNNYYTNNTTTTNVAKPNVKRGATPKPNITQQAILDTTRNNQPVIKKRIFTGYEKINKEFINKLTDYKKADDLIVLINIFQDFKNSSEQKNNAKVMMFKADEAKNNVLIKKQEYKSNDVYLKAINKLIEEADAVLTKAKDSFSKENYLKAESYAIKAQNMYNSINMDNLKKLIRVNIVFKYKGFYYVGDKKTAILIVINNISGIVEDIKKDYLYVREGDIIRSIDGKKEFMVNHIYSDNLILLEKQTKKEIKVPFDVTNTEKKGSY